MITKELAETATEINIIFENLSNDILNKIPMNVRDFFEKIASPAYNFEYDKNKTLVEQELKPKTKGVIALLYRDYICDENEKQRFIQNYKLFLDKQEQTKREKYNPDELFMDLESKILSNNETLPAIYKENRWYTKILNIFKRIFLK